MNYLGKRFVFQREGAVSSVILEAEIICMDDLKQEFQTFKNMFEKA